MNQETRTPTIRELLQQQVATQPDQQTCAFCGCAYRKGDVRPGAVCADCWPDILAIEREAASEGLL